MRALAHRARRAADRLVRPGGRGIVLLYHRVADEPSDPYGLCVTPAAFEEHLEAIRAAGRPLRARDLAAGVAARALPDRAICITFDDGYADNVEAAEPLLHRYDIPATIFVTTGTAGREREFWWDELERVFLATAELPPVLDIRIGRNRIECPVGALAPAPGPHRRQRGPGGWHLGDPDVPSARHSSFRHVYQAVQPLPPGERDEVMAAIVAWAGAERIVRPSRRALEPAEVAALDRRGLVEVAAHTVNHPALPAQPPAVQRAELERSKRDLEEWTGHAIAGFAYPYGLYDDVAVAHARSVGYRYACACTHRHVRPGAEVFELPRIEVRPGSDGDTVARLLRHQLR